MVARSKSWSPSTAGSSTSPPKRSAQPSTSGQRARFFVSASEKRTNALPARRSASARCGRGYVVRDRYVGVGAVAARMERARPAERAAQREGGSGEGAEQLSRALNRIGLVHPPHEVADELTIATGTCGHRAKTCNADTVATWPARTTRRRRVQPRARSKRERACPSEVEVLRGRASVVANRDIARSKPPPPSHACDGGAVTHGTTRGIRRRCAR